MTILSPDNQDIKPDEEFLELFAGVVKSQWSSLASVLLTSTAAEEEDPVFSRGAEGEGEGLSQQDLALAVLKKWASNADATYGQLRQTLNTTPLFQ